MQMTACISHALFFFLIKSLPTLLCFYVLKKSINLELLIPAIWINSTEIIYPFGFWLQCACVCMHLGLCVSKIKAPIFSSSALLQALIWHLNVAPSVLPSLCPRTPKSVLKPPLGCFVCLGCGLFWERRPQVTRPVLTPAGKRKYRRTEK